MQYIHQNTCACALGQSNAPRNNDDSCHPYSKGLTICLYGWRPSLVGWRPSQVGWRLSLLGLWPSLVGHPYWYFIRSLQRAFSQVWCPQHPQPLGEPDWPRTRGPSKQPPKRTKADHHEWTNWIWHLVWWQSVAKLTIPRTTPVRSDW